MAIEREELPAAAELVYPAVLRAIRELMLRSQPDNAWLKTVRADLVLFEENRQVTPTLFYNNMGTLPDEGVRAAKPERQVWLDAAVHTLIWLGQVAGNRIDPTRTCGIVLIEAFGSAAACEWCKREYMARGWLSFMAAQAWAHDAVPRLLIASDPDGTANRILQAPDAPDAQAMLELAERLVTAAGVQIIEANLITWPRANCPNCRSTLGRRAWKLEGSPPVLVAGRLEQ